MSKSTAKQKAIPIKALICDSQEDAVRVLERGLSESPHVIAVSSATSVAAARSLMERGVYNAIFIDPLSLGLDTAAEFIFEIRRTLQEVVFVLYFDRAQAERRRAEFFRGERHRFSHYYSLDKQTPLAAFAEELRASISECQAYLRWRLSSSSFERLSEETGRLSHSAGPEGRALLTAVRDSLASISPGGPDIEQISPRTVFLSYRFAEKEYIGGLAKLLAQYEFEVVTGQSSNTYVSRSVIDRIRRCAFFLSLMTCADAKADGTFTTSRGFSKKKV